MNRKMEKGLKRSKKMTTTLPLRMKMEGKRNTMMRGKGHVRKRQ